MYSKSSIAVYSTKAYHKWLLYIDHYCRKTQFRVLFHEMCDGRKQNTSHENNNTNFK